MTTGQAAKEIGIHPRTLADFLYRNPRLSESFEVVAGRRLIPAHNLDAIRLEARRAGLLPGLEVRNARH
jgi:hypothetical protein